MKLLRSALVASLLAASIISPVQAQIAPVGPFLSSPAQLRTYRATVVGLVPAASATDIMTLGGKALVKLSFIKCSGVTTANATALLQVIKRSTADTGGTSAAMPAVRLNANQPVAGASAKSYTANPTLGTAIGTVDAGYLTTNTLATSSVTNEGVLFDFRNQNLWLDAATTYVALNANGASFSAGASLACTVEWQE